MIETTCNVSFDCIQKRIYCCFKLNAYDFFGEPIREYKLREFHFSQVAQYVITGFELVDLNYF